MTEPMQQVAPYPEPLAALVAQLDYRTDRGWKVRLSNRVRDRADDGMVLSEGLTLTVTRVGPDTYHPDTTVEVNHYFPVPPATYDMRSWRRWLFNRLGDVDTHERCEDFIIGGDRPYRPSHGPGNDPYLVREVGTAEDARTSFTGEPGTPLAHECEHQASNFTPCPVCGK